VLGRAIITLRALPLNAQLFGLFPGGRVISGGSNLVQLTLEVGETGLAKILQTPGLGAVSGVAAAGIAVDALVADVVTGQAITVGVEGFDVFEELDGTECSVRVLGVITDLRDQIVPGFAPVTPPAHV